MKLAALVEVQGGVVPARPEPALNLTVGYTHEEREKDRISASLDQPAKCLEALLEEAFKEFLARVSTEQVRWVGLRLLWLD